MHVYPEPVFPGKFSRPQYLAFAYGIDRMDSHGKGKVFRPRKRPGIKVRTFLPLQLRFGFVIVVEVHIRKHSPESHLRHRPGSCRNMPILVVERRCSRLDHFETCHLRSPVDIVRVDFFFFHPYLVYPVRETDILAYPPQKGHGGVCMRIYQPWQGMFTCTIHDFGFHLFTPGSPVRTCRRYGCNPVILYVNVTRTFPANYVFQYNRTHQIPIENFR